MNRLGRSAAAAVFLFLSSGARADESQTRHPWKLDQTYHGSHADVKQALAWRIPNLMRQTMIDLSVRLGLSFEEGWRYPMTVGFVDSAPPGIENALAYVQLSGNAEGIAQVLHINVAAYQQHQFNFEKVFAHELVHAMLNDACGVEAAVLLPIWLHEGLAVYGAGQGETMLRSYAQQHAGFEESALLNGLEGPHGALDYAEDYLAIKYIAQEHGANRLHNFVREVVRRKGDVPAALAYAVGEKWNDFKSNVQRFGEEELSNLGPVRRGTEVNPY